MAGRTKQPQAHPRARARAWRVATLMACCDVVEPWEHGTIFRASRSPSYYDLNVVRVEEPVALDVAELAAVSDRALAGLEHRLVEFAEAADAESLRAGFERAGWRSLRLLSMRFSARTAGDTGGRGRGAPLRRG